MVKKNFSFLVLYFLSLFVVLNITIVWAAEISRDAKRHMASGTAAMKFAKTEADYQDAVTEFKKAIEYAPDWSDAWFNLGVAQEKARDFEGAINSFQSYLQKNPKASDHDEVETRIFELEYRQEKKKRRKAEQQATKAKELDYSSLSGSWCEMTSSGDIWRCYTKIEVSGSTIKIYFLPPTGRLYLNYWGNIKGYEIKGSYFFGASDLDPNCPNLETPMKGTVSPDAQRIELSYQSPLRYWDSSAPNPSKRCTAEGMETKKVTYIRKQ